MTETLTETEAVTPYRASAASPAPAAIRCPAPGCFRRRESASRGHKLAATCSHCRNPQYRQATPHHSARATGKAVVLTRDVPAEVWSLEACRDSGRVPPEFRVVPAGTRCVAAGRLSKSDGGGDPVVEIVECGGRFVCPLHAMRMVGVPS